MPHCVNCGYDLRGLPPDHRCPECGELTDEAALGQQAQTWYASWRGLLGIGAPPAALLYLRDPRSQSLARRRLVLFCLLPLLLPGVLAVLLDSIRVVSIYERWLERPDRPGERIDTDQCTREWIPFSRLEPGETASVVGPHRRIQTRWRMVCPRFGEIFFEMAVPSIVLGLSGLVAFNLCLRLLGGWAKIPELRPPHRGTLAPALSTLAPYYLVGSALWALSILRDALNQNGPFVMRDGVWFLALGTIILGGANAFGVTLLRCGPRHARGGIFVRTGGALAWLIGVFIVQAVLEGLVGLGRYLLNI